MKRTLIRDAVESTLFVLLLLVAVAAFFDILWR